MQLLRRGDSGPAVEEIREKLGQLGLLVDTPQSRGYFDADVDHAVRVFQQGRRLITDGIVGPDTYRALREAGWTLGDRMLSFTLSSPTSGDDVATLQERLLELGYNVGRPNGTFDQQTEQALCRFQRDYGMTPDGVCGPETCSDDPPKTAATAQATRTTTASADLSPSSSAARYACS